MTPKAQPRTLSAIPPVSSQSFEVTVEGLAPATTYVVTVEVRQDVTRRSSSSSSSSRYLWNGNVKRHHASYQSRGSLGCSVAKHVQLQDMQQSCAGHRTIQRIYLHRACNTPHHKLAYTALPLPPTCRLNPVSAMPRLALWR